jgi:hypothetical protein
MLGNISMKRLRRGKQRYFIIEIEQVLVLNLMRRRRKKFVQLEQQ